MLMGGLCPSMHRGGPMSPLDCENRPTGAAGQPGVSPGQEGGPAARGPVLSPTPSSPPPRPLCSSCFIILLILQKAPEALLLLLIFTEDILSIDLFREWREGREEREKGKHVGSTGAGAQRRRVHRQAEGPGRT